MHKLCFTVYAPLQLGRALGYYTLVCKTLENIFTVKFCFDDFSGSYAPLSTCYHFVLILCSIVKLCGSVWYVYVSLLTFSSIYIAYIHLMNHHVYTIYTVHNATA